VNKPDKNLVDIDPVTVVAIVSAAILLPLLLTGFLGQ